MPDTREIHRRFGAAIRRRRVDTGTSVASLATSSGIDRDELLRVENGEGDSKLDTLQAIARALKTTLSELMRDAETESGRPKDS